MQSGITRLVAVHREKIKQFLRIVENLFCLTKIKVIKDRI